jgi:hypothetical protein
LGAPSTLIRMIIPIKSTPLMHLRCINQNPSI